MNLEVWFKIYTNLSNFKTASPKIILTLKIILISMILFKMGKHTDFQLRFFQVVGAWHDFTVVTKLIRNFKTFYGFRGHCLKIRDICMDFKPYFIVHNLVSVHPKSIILGKMTNLNIIFHVVVSVNWLVKIKTRPRPPLNFGTANIPLVTCTISS